MMNKILLLGAAAALALAGCSYGERGTYSAQGTPTPQSQLIEPKDSKGNGCNFEDSGANCKRPDITKDQIQGDSGK
jgi:hypothetical protein